MAKCIKNSLAADPKDPKDPKDLEGKLIDHFGRTIKYVRLSVTDKCNLRCFYCLPKKNENFERSENFEKFEKNPQKEDWLTFDEIERVIRIFAELGVSLVRITGGEPLLRKNLVHLVKSLSALPGVEDLSLSTNATLLSSYAEPLKNAGVRRINVSLDTLSPNRFAEISGGRLEQVLDGLMAAKAVGFSPIKVNVVALKGVNDGEFVEMVKFCLEHGFTLRFIETMPVGSAGCRASNLYLNLQEVKRELAKCFNLVETVMPGGGGPARYFKVEGTDLCIGFINPISQHFCKTCNRVRLSAEGTLYLCLGQRHKYELAPLLRQKISDDGLKEAIIEALKRKPEGHEFCEYPGQVERFMTTTGG